MSDAQRPAKGNSGESGDSADQASARPARNMADIARLFLDGARPAPPARTSPNQRVSPSREAVPPNAAPAPAPVQNPYVSTNFADEPAVENASVMLGLACGSLGQSTWKLLLQAARGLSEEQDITVALVGINNSSGQKQFVIDVVGAEDDQELQQKNSPKDTSAPDMQIARALHRVRPMVGLWIIAAPDPDALPFPAMASIVRRWLLATATDNDGLVAGYQYLKRAWAKNASKSEPVTPSVFLLSDDYAQAALVHKRLRKAAQEFLKTDLQFAGAGPMALTPASRGNAARQNAPQAEPFARALSLSVTGSEDALWAAVLDELCPLGELEEEPTVSSHLEKALEHVAGKADQVARNASASFAVFDHLANVLDPEERAALAMDFEEPGVAVAPPREAPRESPREGIRENNFEYTAPPREREFTAPVSPLGATSPAAPMPRTIPAKRPTPAPEPPAVAETPVVSEPVDASPTLRAFDLGAECDRAAQWEAVERSIWDLLPKSVLLEAKPPMSWATDTCIAIDREGHLHVWTLYKDGASWFALREWASEHRNLLALTRRDLVMNKKAEVSVHIVLPLQEPSPPAAVPTGETQTSTSIPSMATASSDTLVSILMRTPSKNIHLYRLRIVQWNARRGMVVVPLV